MESTQAQFAEEHGISRQEISACENGKDPKLCSKLVRKIGKVSVVQKHEKCFLYRRRAGVTIREAAEALGVSDYWYLLMEHGREDCSPVYAYWRDRRTGK